MSSSEVTTDGVHGERPARAAAVGGTTGSAATPPADGHGGKRKRRRRNEPEFRSYYDQPVLIQPVCAKHCWAALPPARSWRCMASA